MNYKRLATKTIQHNSTQYKCGCSTIGKDIISLCSKHELKDFKYYIIDSFGNPAQ